MRLAFLTFMAVLSFSADVQAVNPAEFYGAMSKQRTCKVTDPTGTPLNIRTSPNGRIVGRLTNGTTVNIETTSYDGKGRPWARVGTGQGSRYRPRGWVFREFISCY